MRTALFFTSLFLFASLGTNAGTFSLFSSSASCLACNIPDGLAASSVTGTSATLTWNAVSGATQYNVEVEDEQNNPSNFHVETTVSGTSYTVTGLQTGVSYKFKVRTRCGSEKSDWSEWVYFTAGGGNGSGTIDCAGVTGLSVSVTGGIATLTWNAVSGAVKYFIEVEDEQNTPSIFHLEDSTTTNAYTLVGLQTGVLYKFKVRSRCTNGQSDWSTWVFFNGTSSQGGGTGACTAPVMLSTSMNGTSAKLSWNKVSGAAQYYVEVEDEQNVPSNFHVEVSVQDSFYMVTGLQSGVLYKFKVRAHCASGQSDWSNWLFFNGNTGSGNGGNTADCATPTGPLATNVSINSAMLIWNAVPGVVSYTLEIERNQPGTAPWQITQVVTTNSFLLTGLDSDTRYKFKVRSNCSGSSHSDWSAWRKFKTAFFLVNNSDDLAVNRSSDGPAVEAAFEMQTWPNPAQTMTTVRLRDLNAKSVTLRLFDITGRVVQEQYIQQEGGIWEGTLTLGDLPNGLYLLQTQNGSNTQTLKLVVNN